MKKLLLSIFVFLSIAVNAQIEKYISPKPTKLVNDFTNTLTSEQVAHLESKLVAYDDSTSNQVAVVLIPTLKGGSLEDAALKVLRDWGVGGQAQQDNGVVVLIAKDDRKMRIEVGYGLEGKITDLTAFSIIDNIMKPNFREENFYRGIDEAIDAIMKAAAGAYKAPSNYRKKDNDEGIGIGKIIMAIIIISIIAGINSRNRGRGGGMVSRRGWGGWLGPTWMGSGGGWGSGGGGGWSGGGFGGFGGGSGGGGGASGGW